MRVPTADTAFAARCPQWDIDIIGQWEEAADSDRHIRWIRGVWDQMESLMEHRGYVNHIAEDDGADKIRASYGSNFDRLRQLKAKYDPTNLFHLNPNIAPA